MKLNLEKGISSLISHFSVMSSDIDTLGLMFKYWKELLTNPCRIDFHWDLKIVIFNLVHVAHIHHWRDQIGGSCFGNSIHKGCVRASKRKSIKGVSKYWLLRIICFANKPSTIKMLFEASDFSYLKAVSVRVSAYIGC